MSTLPSPLPTEMSFIVLVQQFLLDAEAKACPECRTLGGSAPARCGSSWTKPHLKAPQSLAEALRQHVS